MDSISHFFYSGAAADLTLILLTLGLVWAAWRSGWGQ